MYQKQENRHSEIITVFYQGVGYNKTLCNVKLFLTFSLFFCLLAFIFFQ